ncbi:MAG: hypothetical protein ACK553_14935 [Planctomycetota bacterium]|jgi:hypothetical protein
MKASLHSRFIRALQVGGLLGFCLLLWGTSFLQVQKPVLVCECSALVSEFQQSRFLEVSRRHDVASTSIAWLFCESVPEGLATGGATHLEGEVPARKIRLRVGLRSRATASELEEELARLTSIVSSGADAISALERRGMTQAKWRLRVAEHELSRFRLDCERQGIAWDEPGERSPFRLVSRSSADPGVCEREMLASLQAEVETAKQLVSDEESNLLVRGGGARGAFAITGTPRFVLRGGVLSGWSLAVLLLAAGIVVCGVAIRWGGWWDAIRMRRRSNDSDSRHQDMVKLVRGLGIQYLGVLATVAGVMPTAVPEPNPASEADDLRRSGWRLTLLHRWSDRILYLWIACFVFRYLRDPLWRELLFQSPLAAFSSVLFGV